VPKNEEMGSYQLAQEGQAFVLESICRVGEGQLPDIEEGERLVKLMIDSIGDKSDLLLLATDRRQEFTVSNHCVNVAILGLRIAQELKCNLQEQITVGLAALLHEVVVEDGQVTADKLQRPVCSARILNRLGPKYVGLVETVAQVFERENGSGFPLGLIGTDIREEAKILGAVDAFEAFVNHRPDCKASTGYQFFYQLTTDTAKSFPDHIVKAFLESFSIYPYNEYVILSTGEMGKVVEINQKLSSRPVVKVLFNSESRLLEEPVEIDLAQHSPISILRAITHDRLPSQDSRTGRRENSHRKTWAEVKATEGGGASVWLPTVGSSPQRMKVSRETKGHPFDKPPLIH